jgi:hypothetical protein
MVSAGKLFILLWQVDFEIDGGSVLVLGCILAMITVKF